MGVRSHPFTSCLLLFSLLRTGAGDGSELQTDHKSPPVPGADHGPLGRHFGKFRLLVIAAPGPSDTSYRLMERQVDLSSRALRCELALRDLLVLVLFQGSRPLQGRLLRVSQEGKVLEERLGPEAVEQVAHRLSLAASQFGMVLLRKSLQVYERFPYAVRIEAVLEAVDQMPLRKVESMTRRSQKLKCKGSRAGRPSGHPHTSRNLGNRTMTIGVVRNGTMSIGTLPNRSLGNRTMSIGTLPNRSLGNRTMSIGTLPNRSLGNRTMSIGTLPNRSLGNRTTFIGTLPNRPGNRTMSIGTLPNRSLGNRTTFIGTLPNRPGNRTVSKGSPANTRLRTGLPNSRKPLRFPSGRFREKPGALAPGERTRGKHKALTSPQDSVGERKAKTPRSRVRARASPTGPSQETVNQLMGQITQKVQQMLAAKPRNPFQRRHGGVAGNGSQVSQKGPHSHHHSSATPTMGSLSQSTADSQLGSQFPDTITPSSTARHPNEGNATAFGSKPSTARSQDIQQTPAPSHQPALWGYGSPPSGTTLPGQSWTTLHNPGGRTSTLSSAVQPQEGSGPESPQTRREETEPPDPSVPQPTAASTREKTARERGVGRAPSSGQGRGVLSQPTPPAAQPKAKKEERRGRENSGKRARGKGRKNRRNRKNRKQGSKDLKESVSQQFLEHFRNRRRLLVITAPSEDSRLYVHQRDEYLEHVCQLAIRRISVVIILGSPTNSTLTVEHYQTENEQALENPVTEPVSGDLITHLRKDFGMTFDEFFMVLVDYDMKVKQYFDVPIPIKVLVDYMDTFPSRLPEVQEEKRKGITCLKREGQVNINKFLSRLQWKRRLLILSTPYEEEWTFQQQISAVNGQECNLGIRHVALLKLTGSGEDMSGSLELYPANGRSQVETEKLTTSAVSALREHFQISEEHFIMLLVGKDGTINSWYLSPMWSLATIYEQVDSMQLRQEEMKLQETLGIHCHEEEHYPHYRDYPQRG